MRTTIAHHSIFWAAAVAALLMASSTAHATLTGAWSVEGDRDEAVLGREVHTAGDVNGDGYSDVIIVASRSNSFMGKAYVYLGGATGLSTSPAWSSVGEAAGDWFGVSVSAAGDVNGDGYSDALVGAYHNDANGTNAGKAYSYLGGATAPELPGLRRVGLLSLPILLAVGLLVVLALRRQTPAAS